MIFSIERRKKQRQSDDLKSALQYKRNRPVTKELDLEEILKDGGGKSRTRQEARAFFGKLKDGGTQLGLCLISITLCPLFYQCLYVGSLF